MCMTVCKFGGSSVADAGMFARVRRIIEADPARRYIVLSAPGRRFAGDDKITDLLFRAHSASQLGDYSILARIFARYACIRRVLAPSFPLEMEFARLRRELDTSPDYAASRGEYLCAKLFAAYAGVPFVDARKLLFFRSDGSIDAPKSRSAVRSRLLCHPRAVIPGFYGANPDGSIRTFQRGGSDISGALISAFAGAELYENWTDVDGLFTADPAIVKAPVHSPQVSLKRMEQICSAGAQLLHPDALAPLRGTGIDTMLKNTFAPDAPGTRISERFDHAVRCVTGQRRRLAADGSYAAAVRVFGLTDAQASAIRARLNPIHIINMQDYMEYIIPEAEYETAIRTIHRILMEKT